MEALNSNLFKFKIPSDHEGSDSSADSEDDPLYVTDYLADLPTKVLHRVWALEGLKEKREEIHRAFMKEVALLEQKYEKLYAPLYEDRARIVNGEREVTEEEYSSRLDSSVSLEEEEKEKDAAADVKGIPDFWLNVFKRSQLEGLVFESDEPVLKCLRDVKADRFIDDEHPKIVVSFHFAANEFFTNQVLSLTVKFNAEGDGVVGMESTPIEWKEGKNLCWTTVTRRMKHRNKPGVYTNKESRKELDSFFHLFDDLSTCGHDHSAEEVDDEHGHEHGIMESKIMANAEIVSFLDRYMIPNAIDYYMGLGHEESMGEDEEYGFDDDEDEDEDY